MKSILVVASVFTVVSTLARADTNLSLTRSLKNGGRATATVTLPVGWKVTENDGASAALVHEPTKTEAGVEILEGMTTMQTAMDYGRMMTDKGCQVTLEALAADKKIGITHANISATCGGGLRVKAVFRAFPEGKAVLVTLGMFNAKSPEEGKFVRAAERAVLK